MSSWRGFAEFASSRLSRDFCNACLYATTIKFYNSSRCKRMSFTEANKHDWSICNAKLKFKGWRLPGRFGLLSFSGSDTTQDDKPQLSFTLFGLRLKLPLCWCHVNWSNSHCLNFYCITTNSFLTVRVAILNLRADFIQTLKFHYNFWRCALFTLVVISY